MLNKYSLFHFSSMKGGFALEYYPKPFNIKSLLDLLSRALETGFPRLNGAGPRMLEGLI